MKPCFSAWMLVFNNLRRIRLLGCRNWSKNDTFDLHNREPRQPREKKPSRSRIPRISRSFPFFIAKRREIQFAADAEWPAVLKERVGKILAAHTDKTGKFIECTSVCYEITGENKQ
jgi:hypothetical protein